MNKKNKFVFIKFFLVLFLISNKLSTQLYFIKCDQLFFDDWDSQNSQTPDHGY